jgi:hypothetical protein
MEDRQITVGSYHVNGSHGNNAASDDFCARRHLGFRVVKPLLYGFRCSSCVWFR